MIKKIVVDAHFNLESVLEIATEIKLKIQADNIYQVKG